MRMDQNSNQFGNFILHLVSHVLYTHKIVLKWPSDRLRRNNHGIVH